MEEEAKKRKHSRPATKEVNITSDDGHVDQSSVKVSRSQEQLTWFAHGDAGAIIVFSSPDGSPFEEIIFTVPASGSVSTGRPKDDVDEKSYKYTVVGETGATDPVVIITP